MIRVQITNDAGEVAGHIELHGVILHNPDGTDDVPVRPGYGIVPLGAEYIPGPAITQEELEAIAPEIVGQLQERRDSGVAGAFRWATERP